MGGERDGGRAYLLTGRTFGTACWTYCSASAILWLTIQPVAAAPSSSTWRRGGSKFRRQGTAKAPFFTLARLRDAIRALKRGKGPPRGWRARDHPRRGFIGWRSRSRSGRKDSGTAEANHLHGGARRAPRDLRGRIIRGLRRQADGSWSVTLPDRRARGGVFRQLFINGRRYIRARSPATASSTSCGVPRGERSNRKAEGSLPSEGTIFNRGPTSLTLRIRITFSWNDGHFPVKAVDTENRIVTLAGPAVWELPSRGCLRLYRGEPSGRVRRPRQWQLNRETGDSASSLRGEDLSVRR